MLNLLSLILGIVGIPLLIIGLVPFFGWTNWIWLIVPAVGAILGAVSSSNSGFKLNLVVGAIMVIRLMLGGGIF
ncbi:hypothetical protein [Sphingomicrobium sediminis]|uniref:Uncharacterized protein n=1 Tax=Sphingomicrobium sediminis TaxID=2950949 RepID=A0A9X2EI54_9SPHN|nr:hypothetical protein [Sphingomicrobium sediminis]MCM8558463.1 hypothetical protein [Sphingomicrobium sediminis]